MTTLFDFIYPLIDLSEPLRKDGLPFTYYPNCGALVPDEGVEINKRADGSLWYSGVDYHRRYSKRAIIGKIIGIKWGFVLKNHNPYDWRMNNIAWLSQEAGYWHKKEEQAIIKATNNKIKRDGLLLSIDDYEEFFTKNTGNLDKSL